jgi:ubiquinol-cytochrome c reductase cytochrome c1 subunit
MKVIACLCLVLSYCPMLWAGQGGWGDTPASQRVALREGARTFMDYCLGCHGTGLQRYARVAQDLGIDSRSLRDDWLPAGSSADDPILSALRAADAQAWLGAVPPDLTLTARVRGSEWLYQYLQGFYPDPARPLGVNNHRVPNTAMPDVLEPLRTRLGPQAFDEKVSQLVAFLAYSADPNKTLSQRIGVYVLLYLAVFVLMALLLKREYWKDVR